MPCQVTDKVMVKIENAVVSYREEVALRGASLEVRQGEFVGVIGPNGAGKTTLLTLVNGMGRLLRGRVCVLGEPLTRANADGIRTRVGYVAQVQNIDPRMPISVREVVMIGRYGRLGLLRRPSKTDWAIVDRMLELVGMSHLASRPIGHLSGGEQQRVSIARALAQEPQIFLLDEPTASLDLRAQREIPELVWQVHASQQLTTLYVTHDLNTLPQECHRLVLMKQGRIWREGSLDALVTEPVLSELYGEPLAVVKQNGRRVVVHRENGWTS